MASFASPVDAPPTSAYGPPQVDFSILGNLYNTYQQSKDNQLLLQQRQMQVDQQKKLQSLFASGLPTDAQGNPDYRAIQQALAKAGDISAITGLYGAQQQQAGGQMSPLLGGGGFPQGGAPSAPAPSRPPAPIGDLPPTSGRPSGSTYGGADSGSSLLDIVAGKYGDSSPQTGTVAARIAQTLGVDPNQPLTAGQQRRAQGLLQRYSGSAAAGGVSTSAPAPAAPPLSPNAYVAQNFNPAPPNAPGAINASDIRLNAGAGGYGAGQPVGAPAPNTDVQAGAGVGSRGVPIGPAAPEPTPGPAAGPITPQVPLPKGFTDPHEAIQALRIEAARVASVNPRAKPQADALNDWADRIEKSLNPLSVGPGTTIIDPRTGKVLYQGPQAAQLSAINAGGNSPTLDADAERYRQTGTLPPNMGRGVQGEAEARAIRARAAQMEVEGGGNPADWPARWQQRQTLGPALRQLQTRAEGLTLADNEARRLIPRVRDISDKVSRTQYPTLNSLILAAQKGTGGENVIRLGLAVSSLIPVYARVLKPTGQITEGDTNRASEILEKKWSTGQIDAALDQMEIELDSAKQSVLDTYDEYGLAPPPGMRRPADKGSSTGAASQGGEAAKPPPGFDLVK